MELTKEDLKDGLKFIVGTWEAEFVVSFFSNDLAHVPVEEFKSAKPRLCWERRMTVQALE